MLQSSSIQVTHADGDADLLESLAAQLVQLGFSVSPAPAADSNMGTTLTLGSMTTPAAGGNQETIPGGMMGNQPQGANSGSITTPAAQGDQGATADSYSFRHRWTKQQWDEWCARWSAEDWDMWEAEKLAKKRDGQSADSFKRGWWTSADWKIWRRECCRRGLTPEWPSARSQQQGAGAEASSSSNSRRRPAGSVAEGDRWRVRIEEPASAAAGAGETA